MRFVRKEIIETTVADEIIKDKTVVESLIDALTKGADIFSITYTSFDSSLCQYKKIKIVAFDKKNSMIDIMVMKDNASMRVRSIPISSILCIEINSNDCSQYVQISENITKVMLDLS